MKKIVLYLSLLVVVGWSAGSDLAAIKEKRIVCFYAGKGLSGSRNEAFTARDVDPNLCTHLVYPYANLDNNDNLIAFDSLLEMEKGSYMKFSYLKTFNSNLRTMLTLGNGQSQKLSAIAGDKERRINFARNVLNFLRANWFNGVNIDWQRPGSKYGSVEDKTNYILLLQTLREEFERESNKTGKSYLLISINVPHSVEVLDQGFDLCSLSKYVDFMNVFAFNYRFPIEAEMSHRAALYSVREKSRFDFGARLNIDFTIKHFLKMGVQRDKLVLGIPTYGRTTILYEPNQIFRSNYEEEEMEMDETLAKSEGSLPYYEICKMLKSEGWKVENASPKTAGPYAKRGNYLVSYDDRDSVKLKAEYAVKEALGGIMFWAIDYEDFDGDCFGRRFPLIEAGKTAFTAPFVSETLNNNFYLDKLKSSVFDLASSKSRPRSTADMDTASSALSEKRISLRMTDPYDFSDFDKIFPKSLDEQNTDVPHQAQHQLTADDQLIVQQLVSLVKKLGGVAVLERLLTAPDRASDRSSLDNSLRAYPQESYGPEVASLTVTSPPLTLRKSPLPIVLSNFTVNIEELRIDASSFGST